MLIDGNVVKNVLNNHNIKVNGVLHIGAHLCEEKPFYNSILNVPDDNIVWVECNPALVNYTTSCGIKNVFCATLDKEEKEQVVHLANNGQSSSLLEMGTHADYYNHIYYIGDIKVHTKTLSNFLTENKLDEKKYNFYNLDIQGKEYDVLLGSEHILEHIDAIYTEVNEEYVYKNCGLMKDLDVLLENYGFKRVLTHMTEHKWGDALYVKNKNS